MVTLLRSHIIPPVSFELPVKSSETEGEEDGCLGDNAFL